MNQTQYVQAVLRAYLQLPETSQRPRTADRKLAAQLYRRQVPLQHVLGAMRLATARRLFRPPPPLPPIRSLHYFLPVIDEIENHDVDPEYLEYLEYKLRHSCPIYRPLHD